MKNNKTKLVLSIDWDFFFKESPMLDWGHRESTLFLNEMWAIRESHLKVGQTLRDVLPMTEIPLCVIVALQARYQPPNMNASSESHALMVPFVTEQITGQVDVVNFDAHHDICYGTEKDDCGNWVRTLFRAGRLRRYTIVYPDWRKEKGYEEGGTTEALSRLPDGCAERVTVTYWSDWLKAKVGAKRRPEAMFICRSGCWVPPCYDSEFNAFTSCLVGETCQIEERKINANIIEQQERVWNELAEIHRVKV